MSDLKLPGDDKKKKDVPFTRLAIWIIVGGFAIYLIVTGIIGGINAGAL